MTAFQEYLLSPWLYYTLMTVYALSILTVIIVILSENRNPVKSLAWMTVLLVVPGVGLVLYIFFGRNIQRKHLISRRNLRKLRRTEASSRRPADLRRLRLSPQSVQLVKLAHSLAGAVYHEWNSASVFTDAREKMDALIADIDNARDYINIEYYIIDDDNIGRRFQSALIQAARRGVRVRVIYDHVGSFSAGRKFWKELRQAGVDIHPFFRVVFPIFATHINWRNHRKIAVIDGRAAYIGGMNIADRYLDGGKKFDLWRDTHLRLTGPVVRALRYSFAIDWNFMGQPLLENDIDLVSYPATDAPRAGMQLLTSGPTSQWSNIAFMFHKAIAGAKRRVYLQTPYFLPTEGLLKALQVAALAHVDVRVIIPRHSDSKMLTYASYSYIAESLKSGIKIYFYEPGMLHAKTLIIDDEFTSVGSTNFDFRSFECNFESNIFIYSKEVNAQMSDIFNKDLGHSTRIIPFEWRNRPYRQKAVESLVRLLSPIL